MKMVPLALLAPCFLSSIFIECKDEQESSASTIVSYDEFKANPSKFYNVYFGLSTGFAAMSTDLAAASSKNADLESRTLYYTFTCAMRKFKTTTDYVFQRFGLKSMGNIPAKKLPEKMYLHIKMSDKLKNERGDTHLVRLRAGDVGFAKWYKLVTCDPTDASCYPYVSEYIEPLHTKLDAYYHSHTSLLEKAHYPITNLQTFYEYFAITMQRVYLLGCLFEHQIFNELEKYTMNEDNNFIEIFHKLLPDWSITELEIDLVNIAWLAGGGIAEDNENQLLKVGYDLGRKYKDQKGKVIPITDTCLRAHL